MLLIEHYVAPSSIHGLGVFAAALVPKGTKVWEFHPVIDRMIASAELVSLPSHVVSWIRTYAEYFAHIDRYLLSADADKFMNHSEDANIFVSGSAIFSLRDIVPNEEVTCNYKELSTLALGEDRKNQTLASILKS